MGTRGSFTEEDVDIVKLESTGDDGARMGWVNVGTHAVQISLDSKGALTVEVCARTNEGQPLGKCVVTREASVEAGGVDPDRDDGDDVHDVVDDVLARAETYGFQPDEDIVRGAVEESANLLSIELSEEQVVEACTRVMQPQDVVAERQPG